MLESFQIVGTQVLALFVIIAIGVLGANFKFITKAGVSSMTDIMLYLVTPCVIINSFQIGIKENNNANINTNIINSEAIETFSDKLNEDISELIDNYNLNYY